MLKEIEDKLLKLKFFNKTSDLHLQHADVKTSTEVDVSVDESEEAVEVEEHVESFFSSLEQNFNVWYEKKIEDKSLEVSCQVRALCSP